MWNIIQKFSENQNIVVFIHGYEIRNWSRDISDLRNYKEAIERSYEIKDLWNSILQKPDKIKAFVFVSAWMRNAAEEDIGKQFPSTKTHIIHNYIDTNLFSYKEKDINLRYNILIIRKFTKKYAVDITYNIMCILKKHPLWKKISINIFGQGPELSKFKKEFLEDKNVTINEKFLTQEEISNLHGKHGILLIPTRLDSQGVSRDEAMASGLVPITNSVCAIPEFVDDTCSQLAPAEDYNLLAQKIIELIQNPNLFSKLSQKARKRVEAQSSYGHTIKKEELIFNQCFE